MLDASIVTAQSSNLSLEKIKSLLSTLKIDDLIEQVFPEVNPTALHQLYCHCHKLTNEKNNVYHPGSSHEINKPWQLICLAGDLASVINIFENSENCYDNVGATPIHYVALRGDAILMTDILKQFPSTQKQVDNIGRNYLHYVAWSGSEELLSSVFPSSSSTLLDSKTLMDWNFCHFAAWSGSTEAIQFCLTNCIEKAKEKTKQGFTITHLACFKGATDAIRLILKTCEDLTEAKTNAGNSNLLCVISSDCVDAFELLMPSDMESQKTVNTIGGNTTLHAIFNRASKRVSINILKFLLTRFYEQLDTIKDDIDILGDIAGNCSFKEFTFIFDNYPALREFKEQGFYPFVQKLCQKHKWRELEYVFLKHAHFANFVTDNDANLLHLAATLETAVFEFIKPYCGHSIDSTDKNGDTIVHYAAEQGNAIALSYFIMKYPALAKTRNLVGANILHLACHSGKSANVICALTHFSHLLESTNNLDQTVLHYAKTPGKF